MTILRYYRMQAAEGKGEALATMLAGLAAKVAPLDGCEHVDLFADPDDATAVVFIEYWSSVDAHKAAGKALGKEAFAPVMTVLAQPPQGFYLEPKLTVAGKASSPGG